MFEEKICETVYDRIRNLFFTGQFTFSPYRYFGFPGNAIFVRFPCQLMLARQSFPIITALTGKLSLNIDRETVFLVSYVIDGETYPFLQLLL